MEALQLSLAKILLLALQIQLALAQTPVIAPTINPGVLLAPPGIESLTHYPELLKLAKCESGDKYIVALDRNKLYSYGYLQFQLATFITYGKRYDLIPATTTNPEMIQLTKSRDLQFKIADAMLSDSDYSGGLKNWWNCAHIQGLLK